MILENFMEKISHIKKMTPRGPDHYIAEISCVACESIRFLVVNKVEWKDWVENDFDKNVSNFFPSFGIDQKNSMMLGCCYWCLQEAIDPSLENGTQL